MNIKIIFQQVLFPWGRMSLLWLLSSRLYGQEVLDTYIQEGLTHNQVVQQRNLSLQQAENSLKIARSYFMPSVTLLGDYTSGEGGRSISIPIGDMLNPVYSSLNQLTGSDNFPKVDNVSQNFFPSNFYDARVRTSIPIINTDLHVNRSIQSQQIFLKQYELDAYKRQLVCDIKVSYYTYLAAIAAVKIYESGLILVNKNVEINESLIRNGKGLPANLLRSRSEADRLKADLNSARNKAVNAQKYFNFLLNRELDAKIEEVSLENELPLSPATQDNINSREELAMVRTGREITQASLLLNKLNRVPKVNAFLDLGSQASDWKYSNKTQYYLVGVQLTLPLFQGLRNNLAIRQSKLDLQKAELNLHNLTQQVQLSAEIAKNELQTTTENLEAAKEQLKSAQSYFNLIEKGYQQGVNSLIEFLDARNQLTASELQQNLRSLEMLTAAAKWERETAAFPLANQK